MRARYLRSAIDFGFQHLDEHASAVVVVSIFAGAVACVGDDTDTVDAAACDMVALGTRAVVLRDAESRAAVRAWDAQRRGANNGDTFALLEIAEAVEWASALYRSNAPLHPVGVEAIQRLHWLLHRRYARVAHAPLPSVAQLEEWVARHARHHRRNALTTAGIVARIVHSARLFGARGTLAKTLQRVDRVLNRLADGWARHPVHSTSRVE